MQKPPGDDPGGLRSSDCRNQSLPAAAATAAAAAAMPVCSFLVRRFGAEILQFANSFLLGRLSLHRKGSSGSLPE
jgi:hypothetical protein